MASFPLVCRQHQAAAKISANRHGGVGGIGGQGAEARSTRAPPPRVSAQWQSQMTNNDEEKRVRKVKVCGEVP